MARTDYPGMGQVLASPGTMGLYYPDYLAAAGASRATALTDITKFYDELEETARQFDEAMAQADRHRTEELAFERYALESGQELDRARIELDRELGRGQLELGRGQLELGRSELEGLEAHRGETLDRQRREDEYRRGEDVWEKDYFNQQLEMTSKKSSTQSMFEAYIASLIDQQKTKGGPASGETVVPGAGGGEEGGEEGGTEVTSGLKISGSSGTHTSGIYKPTWSTLDEWEMYR